MQIIFLGTSSGTPTRYRNVSGTGIRCEGAKSWCLVDCGEGTQHRILNTSLGLTYLEVIFITHVHGDHCFGLPGLLASASLVGRTRPLTIVGPAAIEAFIFTAQRISETVFNFDINFIDISEYDAELVTAGFIIDVVELSHRVPSYGIIFEEKNVQRSLDIDKLNADGVASGPVWGLLQKGENVHLPDGEILLASDYSFISRKARKLIVCGDNDNPALLAKCADGLDVLVHEATYTEAVAEKVGFQSMHSTAKSVAQFAESISLGNLVLTHFSARYKDYGESPNIADIEHEAKQVYSGELFLADDLDVFVLDRNGELRLAENSKRNVPR